METMNARRNVGADIVRCLALLFMISVHFFFRNGYYNEVIVGKKMILMTAMRSLFIICVPLFMMLSGYLMRQRALSVKHYKKLGKTYMTYLLICLCCMIYAAVYIKQERTVVQMILATLNFTGSPYSWYVEMYLGFFLLIPFLNILYNNIPSQNWKKVLILVMIILTALPSVINAYNFSTIEWWADPASIKSYSKLIPQWWTRIYPVTYYFIGCYLSEYGLKIKKWLHGLLIIVAWAAVSVHNLWRSSGSTFVWGDWADYESLLNVVLATLIFSFFTGFSYEKVPQKLATFLKRVSALCFGAYLLSWIFDYTFYPILNQKVPNMPDRLYYYWIMVPVVYVCSLAASYIISKVQWGLGKLWSLLVWLMRKCFTRKTSTNITDA